MNRPYLLTTEDGRKFALTDKEFETFETLFGEAEVVEGIDFSKLKVIKEEL